jgi:probable H4MPT-linked C1 transfer pathway protein
VIGLDIGGANIKASDGESRSVSRPFALWQAPERLAGELREVLAGFDGRTALAVTMTGELADCFTTKSEGVAHILSAVEEASGGRPIHVWQTGGEFVTPAEARDLVPLVAAANWHALATWAGRMTPRGWALLLDCGSTTTDIIPLHDGLPLPEGRTDLERLQSGELVYTGVRRTPVCAVAPAVPFRGRDCPLAAEVFATMRDVYLWLKWLPEEAVDLETADGRPATRTAARNRLARSICCDGSELRDADVRLMAEHLAERQRRQISTALDAVLGRLAGRCEAVLLCGEGEVLLRRMADGVRDLAGIQKVSLQGALGEEHSRAACAFALARLLTEGCARNDGTWQN